jgi:hypothetical protein
MRDWGNFEVWQGHGYHVMPSDYYTPIPDTDRLDDAVWDWRLRSFAFDFRPDEQLELLKRLKLFRSEYVHLAAVPGPDGQPLGTWTSFGPVDREVLYAVVREYKPARVIEVGAGASTFVTGRALLANAEEGRPGTLVSIEPFPHPGVREAPGLSELIVERMQDLPAAFFDVLGAGDILFIDSSHVYKTGSDVQYQFTRVLPRLAPGVLVHLHDIFLPSEYPRQWVVDRHIFWNEQHHLESFLAFNSAFAVRWASSYLHLTRPDDLTLAFPGYLPAHEWPGSFWMEKVATRQDHC